MTFNIIAVGDISFGDFPFCPGIGVRSCIEKNLMPFQAVAPILKKGDIVFGNLETVISDKGLDPTQLESCQMRGAPKSSELLVQAGFNILNIANNHIMQHGTEAFSETVEVLKRKGIEIVGLIEKTQVNSVPVIIIKNGLRIGFLGYAFEKDIYADNRLGYAYGPKCRIKQDIKSLKKVVDLLIVSCHWGLEFITEPSPITVLLGRKIIEYGANIVLGHHPHVLQGYEKYKDGIIIYSMGNFLFDMLWNSNLRESAIFKIGVENGKINVKTIPVYISNDYEILLQNKKYVLQHEKRMKNRCEKVKYAVVGDVERKTLRYYLEYEKLRKVNRYKSIFYFLKNFYKIEKKILAQIILKKLTN